MLLASELDLGTLEGGTEVNLGICRALGAKTYLSGPFGRDYLDRSRFRKEGIQIVYHNFTHPTYKQLFKPFAPNMSSVDLLFNYGSKARDVLFSNI